MAAPLLTAANERNQFGTEVTLVVDASNSNNFSTDVSLIVDGDTGNNNPGSKPGGGTGNGSGSGTGTTPGEDEGTGGRHHSGSSTGIRPGRPPAITKPTQNPSGVKAGGVDGDGNPYCLLDGVYVAAEAYELGYMYGFSDGNFGPDGYLTRAQFAAIMDRVFEFDETSITKSFQDTKGNWAEAHINRLASRGVIYGVNENEFRPNGSLTKGHVPGTVPHRRRER